ncbi:MAG: DMT family transporter [Boseongicola sp.]|nr:DMT family transporter [Boseongicola sp.]
MKGLSYDSSRTTGSWAIGSACHRDDLGGIYAVQLLGAAETAAFCALTPILALLGGVAFLVETVTPLKVMGIILVAAGVFLASGVTGKPQPASVS